MPFVSGWKDSTANSVSGRTSGIPGSYRPQGRVSFQVDVTTRAGSRQSRDSSRLSDDPTAWSGTTRLRWSRPGARFKRQAWSDIWCRPRLCRGPAWPRTARAYIGSRAPGYRRATAHHCLPARRRTSGGARDQPSHRYPLHRTYAARSQAHSSDRVRRHGTAELDVFIVSVIATRIFSTTSGRSGSPYTAAKSIDDNIAGLKLLVIPRRN